MESTCGWAVLGPGAIARRFVSQLPSSRTGRLVAVGSSDPSRARALADEVGGDVRAGTYDEVLADPAVDAVYIATVHTSHARLALAAIAAGKHVLVEKPLAPNLGSVMAVVDAARAAGVTVVEAYMYRFHPQTELLLRLVREGAIGAVQHVDASFSFAVPAQTGRLFDPALAGGGILDVGGYPVSMARAVAGAAIGAAFAEPLDLRASGRIGSTGVDEWALAHLTFADGMTASLRTGVRLADPQSVTVYGSNGYIALNDPWTIGGNTTLTLRVAGAEPQVHTFASDSAEHRPYALEADGLAAAVAGSGEAGLMSLDDSLGNARVLDRWRAAIGLRYPFETDTSNIPTVSGRPLAVDRSAPMRYGAIPGLTKPVSRLVMGCDNQPDLAQASSIFDAFFSSGGNTFDTAWLYGKGYYEKLFGQWMANRGIRDDVVVIVKGAHTPHCDPESLSRQLLESLDRQQHDRADIYMMHRDNPEIPVGEFVDVMNEHVDAGRITVFGGSNWTPERVDAADAYAAANGKRGFSVLSNHFGLAEAYDVPWAGCVQMTDPTAKAWLERKQIPLLPWSSQARGFFARADANDHSDAELVRCYYSDGNFERKRRAEKLGADLGVPATAVALAFVLSQTFPTFPLFGPRSTAEMRSSMAGLSVDLDAAQLAWLDLRD
ncbi:Predicted oxidoreductase [Nakamurella panacisegetis]|uniref:Predicted oxidoreductase n=1 Tax=Nakamurella panacisegetis TaxID=1090615 RepID=A0A1H0N5L6_9ACTN|nr:aldo/keto reductase [Nakamurella panacisegetis]SDO87690.1 Predicted oxidoreductase [Nakamurella panacisegetis]